ncbi:putative SIFamide preprohormone [Daphnia pulex]|uniref:Putative SIFamide preprohormone n=1 Tax=Daphnia pulex TaxID=6669 RepID=E9HJY4_DAPPU|nr:putative SIFamide preprohormone [Daphnia pulex]|eukprot:EFX67946.1 putative SIFamide preprohormone [Daphnia pulex]
MRSSFIVVMVCVVVVLTFWGQVAEATRKLPFNGSIFGKRSNQGTDKLESPSNLQLLCDAAMNACSDWLPIGSK